MKRTNMNRLGCGVALVLALTACGGGGGTTDAGGGPPGPSANYYDVRGYGVPAAQEAVAVGRWPSWRREKELVAACSGGDVFYGDQCWNSVTIDADAGTVEFATTGVGSAVLALGDVVPTLLGSMVTSEAGVGPCQVSGGGRCASPHHTNTGYVFMAGSAGAGVSTAYFDLWDWITGSPLPAGRPTTRAPWALGNKLLLDDAGLVTGFVVKTTQLYGFVATKPSPLFLDFQIAHNWSYRGSLKVNGTTLPLPVRLADVATAIGGSTGLTSDGSPYIDLPNHRARFVSQKQVIQARGYWGGNGPGLSESDLVTSVELQTTAMSAP